MTESFDEKAFAASAAALLASHKMSDSVWDEYFPELPKWQPELRTILIKLHQRALEKDFANISETLLDTQNRFDVSDKTAREYIKILVNLNFVKVCEGNKENEVHLVPTNTAKEGLFKVGQDYLGCLQMVAPFLAQFGAASSSEDLLDASWFKRVKQTVQLKVANYNADKKASKKWT